MKGRIFVLIWMMIVGCCLTAKAQLIPSAIEVMDLIILKCRHSAMWLSMAAAEWKTCAASCAVMV